jgi:WD repeat-containing protein 24
MDRLPVAHSGPILGLDWSNAASSAKDGLADDSTSTGSGAVSTITSGGWIVSGGLDRTVKVRPPPSILFH